MVVAPFGQVWLNIQMARDGRKTVKGNSLNLRSIKSE